jgi:arsenate reductase
MTQVALYGLKSCDTCRKAMRLLDGAEFIDVRAKGVPTDVLDRAVVCLGDALVNRRSTTWRTLDEADRALPPADLVRKHPAVMKRPLIVAGDDIHLGWDDKVRAALGVA